MKPLKEKALNFSNEGNELKFQLYADGDVEDAVKRLKAKAIEVEKGISVIDPKAIDEIFGEFKEDKMDKLMKEGDKNNKKIWELL